VPHEPPAAKDLRYGVLFYEAVGEGPIDTQCRRPILCSVGWGIQVRLSGWGCELGWLHLQKGEHAASAGSALDGD
jgi:hypothetical protein